MVPAMFAPFPFAGHEMLLGHGRALYWPAERALLVADLHLEKASWFAQRGQMLPPYDSRDTLERLADAVRITGARRVITLGDNFHDDAGALRLDAHCTGMLEALTRALDWVWITGNHDEELPRGFGGTIVAELEVGGIKLRHQARAGEAAPELSGHYHPKMRMTVRGRHIARPCAVLGGGVLGRGDDGAERMILPAFGTLTGGLDAGAPEILGALQPAHRIEALIPARGQIARFPLWTAAAQVRV